MATNSPRSTLKLTPWQGLDIDIARVIRTSDVLHI